MDNMYLITVHLINLFDGFDEAEQKVGFDSELTGANRDKRPTVLVFLPGIHEIRSMQRCLEDNWNQL